MLCMTEMEMSLLFTVLLLCLMVVIVCVLRASVDRSVGRRKVIIKMKKIRGGYPRLRMKLLCRW